jgi:transcriptional regulator with XRE-family HTH domain
MDDVHPIRAYREKERISAKTLAERLRVARNTIWRWESGRQQIDRELWDRVHLETGIPIEQLAGIKDGKAA